MKTMGLSHLYLVAPLQYPHPKAVELASNAVDILEQAKVVATLDEAIHDCSLIVGTSTRVRTIPWPLLTPREFAKKASIEAQQIKIALLLGREQSGLTNDELQRCHFHIQIPANPEYPSLNIAAALQVIAYELFVASESMPEAPEAWDYPASTAEQMELFYEHLERVLLDIKFLNPQAPRQLLPRLRRLFHRARPDTMEMNILRGILSAIEKK
jgi:tRNA (cytidine32/uridine32-2'-O)-methyltransferase